MAEAVISRSSSGGGDSVSNETKQSLGLSNNATLDDVIKILQLKDDKYGTILVTVLNPDNSPVVNSQVQMKDKDGSLLNYTTNAQGKCLFKTQSGQATFSDLGYGSGYFDLKKPNDIKVDCPVGSVSSITLQRNRNFVNGQNIKITSNQTIKFSSMAKSADVEVSGAGGASATSRMTANMYATRSGSWSIGNINAYEPGGAGGNGHTNKTSLNDIKPNSEYKCIIGLSRGGAIGWSYDNYEGWFGDDGTSNRGIYFWNAVGGNTGESSSFGGIISAAGGLGGKCNTTSRSYGGNGALGATDSRTIHISMTNLNWDGYKAKGWTTTTTGSAGYIWLNNFQYR